VLIQAEPRRAGIETLDAERVRAELIAIITSRPRKSSSPPARRKGWRRSTPTIDWASPTRRVR
jgi:hypothetical protein